MRADAVEAALLPTGNDVSPYLPHAHELKGLLGLTIALVLTTALGAAFCGRRFPPEVKLICGWGLACLVLTGWGLVVPLTMRWPLAALALCGTVILLIPRLRRLTGPSGGAGRMLLLLAPALLVLSPLRPSEIDTWWNLLPNAAYLFDVGVLPTVSGPPSHSFLPLAPYNTQFAAFAASVVVGDFADGAMGLFNVALLCAACLAVARAVATGDIAAPVARPAWWACACGFLIAIPANPGFTPRVFLSAYGEAPLAVTLLFAVWLAAAALGELAKGSARPRAVVALALVLAAMVNIKQSGLGLVLPVGATMLAIGWAHPAIGWRRALAASTASLLPALVLYGAWRMFASGGFPDGELKLLPMDQWNWDILPGIALAMLHAAGQRATLFVFEAAVLVLAVLRLRRLGWQGNDLIVLMVGGVILLFNAFLVFTYLAHFPPIWALEAHSFFRYSSQLSLAIVLALTLALRPLAAAWLTRLGATGRRRLAGTAVGATLLLPLACVVPLRFDLDAPQPELRRIGAEAAAFLAPDSRLAVLVPGDVDDSVGSMLRGVILFTPPRRPGVDLHMATTADAATLAAMAADGVDMALISCAPAGLADAPVGRAALLRHAAGQWRTVASWAYPPDLARRRFGAMLAREPLCARR